MAGNLTKTAIDGVGQVDRETYLCDGEFIGFGLRVRPTGSRSSVCLFRPGGGRVAKQQRVTVGSYGTISARDKARKLAGDVARDRGPAETIRNERTTERRAKSTKVEALVPLFIEQNHGARGNRWADEAGRTLTFDAVRKWGQCTLGMFRPTT